MTLRRIWLALLVLVLVGCNGVQPNGVPALNPTTGPEGAVARITYPDGSEEYLSQATLDALRSGIYVDQTGQPVAEEIVLQELITRRLLLRLARNTDVVADADQITAAVSNLSGPNSSFCQGRTQTASGGDASSQRAAFDACAQSYGFSSGDDLRGFISDELTINDVSRAEAPRDLYRAAHILFATEDFAGAQTTYADLCGGETNATVPEDDTGCRGSGGNFALLARERSADETSRLDGGELPPFDAQGFVYDAQGRPDQNATPFDATFVSNTVALSPTLQAGGTPISAPFQTDFGWHIVRLLGLEASDQSVNTFRQAIYERAVNATADEIRPDQIDLDAEIPLIGRVEILKAFPEPVVVPTVEPVVPEPTEEPEATEVIPQEGAEPPEATVTTEPIDEPTPESTAEVN